MAWMEQEPAERKLNFLPQKFPSLRTVPAYSRFIQERFERCLDLYLCPRQRKMRVCETAHTGLGGVWHEGDAQCSFPQVNVDPEDLIPKLPRPRDLQPFPVCQALVSVEAEVVGKCPRVSVCLPSHSSSPAGLQGPQ